MLVFLCFFIMVALSTATAFRLYLFALPAPPVEPVDWINVISEINGIIIYISPFTNPNVLVSICISSPELLPILFTPHLDIT